MVVMDVGLPKHSIAWEIHKGVGWICGEAPELQIFPVLDIHMGLCAGLFCFFIGVFKILSEIRAKCLRNQNMCFQWSVSAERIGRSRVATGCAEGCEGSSKRERRSSTELNQRKWSSVAMKILRSSLAADSAVRVFQNVFIFYVRVGVLRLCTSMC